MIIVYQLSTKTKDSISNELQRKLGFTYEEFMKFDIEKQQSLISEYHKKNNCKKNRMTLTILGSGVHSMFIKVKKGERIMVGMGEDSCFIKSGISLEKSRRKLDDRIDDALYNKPVALVKKIHRRLKK